MFDQITNTKRIVLNRTGGFEPEAGIILGSGLGALADRMEVLYALPYGEIAGFPVSTVEGHSGRLLLGMLGGRKVVVMQGRFHCYEGYSPAEVVFPVRVMKALGIRTLFVSNAAGGLNPDFRVGDLMAIEDHISFLPNPLIGRNEPELGTRFPDMSEPYSRVLIARAEVLAGELGFGLRKGCYVGVTGPCYETRAELRFYRMIGGDAVGMSTVPEVIAARHAGLEVFAVSVITNLARPELAQKASHEEVVAAGNAASERMTGLFTRLIEGL